MFQGSWFRVYGLVRAFTTSPHIPWMDQTEWRPNGLATVPCGVAVCLIFYVTYISQPLLSHILRDILVDISQPLLPPQGLAICSS